MEFQIVNFNCSQLDLEISTINIGEQLLCDEYTNILNSSASVLDVSHIEELIGMF